MAHDQAQGGYNCARSLPKEPKKIEDLAVDDQWSCLPASNAYGFWTHVATVDILIASAALYLGDIHICTWYSTGQQCPVGSSSRWVTARKTYLYCYRTGVTSYLHQAIDLWFDNSCLTYVQNMEPKPYEFTICMVIPILQYHTIRYHSENRRLLTRNNTMYQNCSNG